MAGSSTWYWPRRNAPNRDTHPSKDSRGLIHKRVADVALGFSITLAASTVLIEAARITPPLVIAPYRSATRSSTPGVGPYDLGVSLDGILAVARSRFWRRTSHRYRGPRCRIYTPGPQPAAAPKTWELRGSWSGLQRKLLNSKQLKFLSFDDSPLQRRADDFWPSENNNHASGG